VYLVSALFLILSGTAALTYQVAWVRLLGLSMGSTSAAISTVLAAFFLGMALGSYGTERITRNRINSLYPYLLLEIVIAISGLVLLPILLNLDSYMASFGVFGTDLSSKFFLTLALLLVPTVAMGATFPVMAGILVRRQGEIGLRLGQLYSLNTLGAVFGALLSGFLFIPAVGLDGAIYIAVTLNLVIAVSGWLLNRHIKLPPLEKEETGEESLVGDNSPDSTRWIAMTALFATGFVSIATEVGWTKYLSIFTGTTIYGFAAILSIFLFGIALGSWAIKNYIHRIQNPAAWLALGLAFLAVILLITRGGLSLIPNMYEGINHMGIDNSSKQLIKYFIMFVLLIPSTFILGALFPVNVRLYCGDLSRVRSRVGRAYAINTIASILGSLAAGFWIIPQYGTDALLSSMAFITLIVAFSFLFITPKTVQRVAIVSIGLLALVNHLIWPHIDYKELIASVDYQYDDDAYAGKEAEFLFLKEGKVSVISVVSHDGRYAKVQANGLNESIIDMEQPGNALIVESLLAYMPYFLHPDPKKAFVVGYGGGITTRALTHTDVESIRVVELEPAVVEAGHSIKNGPTLALKDPRVTLEFNDARNSLLIENLRYDIIAAQASHPWLAGASNVFTQEFFEIVKSRLNEGGYYSQWVNLFRMDVTTLRAIFQAFINTFPYVTSFANTDSGDFMLLGSLSPIYFDYQQIETRMQTPQIKQALSYHGVFQPRDLFWYYGLSQNELFTAADNATPNRDTNILSEVRLSGLANKLSDEQNPYPFLFKHFQLDTASYFSDPDEYARHAYELGLGFLEWENPSNTAKLITQLEQVSKIRADSLQHKLFFWQRNFTQATQWFDDHTEFLDEVYVDQMQIYLERNEKEKARAILEDIKAPEVKRNALAQWAYLTGDDSFLMSVKDPDNKWATAQRLRKHQSQAANKLYDMMQTGDADPLLLRLLARHYLETDENEKANQVLKQLNEQTENRVRVYLVLIEEALKLENTTWTKELLSSIRKLDSENEALPALQTRLEATNPSKTSQK